MAIQKGSKNEIAVNWKKENSNDLIRKISKLLENPNLNSIVSIHNYISDSNLPVKIYDNKKALNPLNSDESDFETFFNLNKDKFFKNPSSNNISYLNNIIGNDNFNHKKNAEGKIFPVNFIDKYGKSPYYLDPNQRNRINDNEEFRINYDQIFRDYLNYTKNKLKENSKFLLYKGFFGKFFFKFWELYYFDDYFFLYMSVFTILVGIIVLLIVIILRIRVKNNRLKDKLKRKKSGDSTEENINNINNNSNTENKAITSEFKKHNSPDENSVNDDNKDKNFTCFKTDLGTICVYNENLNIQNLKKMISENCKNHNFARTSDNDFIIISDENSNFKDFKENEFLSENKKLFEMQQSIQILKEPKVNLTNNKQFEELFKPQLDFNLKKAEIQNRVESTFCILKDADGKIVKIENKQLVTKYNNNPEVAERIMQVTGQIGLINILESKSVTVNNNEIKANEGVMCEYNKNKFAIYSKASNNIYNRFAKLKFFENIEISKTNSNNLDLGDSKINAQNSEEFVRAKSNNAKKPDFQPIQFSIKAVQEEEKTEFTFEKGNISSLGLYNASTETNYIKYDSNSDLNVENISNAKEVSSRNSELKIDNSLMLVKKTSKNLISDNNNYNTNVYEEKSIKSKFQISVKNRSSSKQRIKKNGSFYNNNNSNTKENGKNGNNNINNIINFINEKDDHIKNSPAADNMKNAIYTNDENQKENNNNKRNKNKNENFKNNLCSTSKTNNLNLKCKYKEYKEFNISDPNEKNKLLKIDTTFIDEGRIGKNFEEFSKVGEGGFGSVFKAKHKIDGSLYAIKVIKLDVGISQSLKDHKVIKEVKTMMKLYHKNVVRYYTCWFQLNIDEIKNLKSESDIEDCNVTESCVSNSNLFITETKKKNNNNYNKNKNNHSNYSDSFFGNVSNFQKTCVKNETGKKQAFESERGFSKASKSKPFLNNLNKNNNNKIIKKINFNNLRDKSPNDSKCYESHEKSRINVNESFYNNNTYNSKSNYLSKSVNKNNNHSNNAENRKSFNPFIELNATKSAILNQISENGESDFNSKNISEAAGGFNWEDSNFISKKITESFEKSQMENSLRRGRSSENSKMNISYNGNSFWNDSKKDYIEKSIKQVIFAGNNDKINKNQVENFFNNKNNEKEKNGEENIGTQIRKFSSLTEEINHDNNLCDKKAFSISLEKNAEEILSDSNEEEIAEESYFSNVESKNTYKNNNNNNRNKNANKKHAQDDSVIDLTKRNKKKKKEFVYNVYFLVQMEFCDGLSLNQYLEMNKSNGLNSQTIFSFFKQILSGVNQIHKSNIIHRDLK